MPNLESTRYSVYSETAHLDIEIGERSILKIGFRFKVLNLRGGDPDLFIGFSHPEGALALTSLSRQQW